MANIQINCRYCEEPGDARQPFCTGCGAPLEAAPVPPELRRPVQTQFAVPSYLREASQRDIAGRRRPLDPDSGSGGGFILSGGIAIAAGLLFGSLAGPWLALPAGGFLLICLGFWRMREDPVAMERTGWLLAGSSAIVLGALLFQFAPGSASVATDAARTLGSSEETPVPIASASLTAPASVNTVSMYGGDAAHSGMQPGPGPNAAPEIAWRTYLGGELYSSPVVANGLVYIGSKSGFLVALDGVTGQERWRVDLGGYIIRSTPAVANGTVYASAGYAVFARDVLTGAERWRAPIRFAGPASPLVEGNILVVPAQEGRLYGFDLATGHEQWSQRTDGLILGAPAAANDQVIYGDQKGRVYAFDTRTGHERWRKQIGGAITGAPAILNGVAFVASETPTLSALDMSSGALLWQRDIGGSSAIAASGDTVYLGTSDRGLTGLNATTGETRWSAPGGETARSLPALTRDAVYFASGRSVTLLDRESGTPRWTFPSGGEILTSPGVANGLVYVASQDGFLYAIGATAGNGAPSPERMVERP